jgi:hypothetical protein
MHFFDDSPPVSWSTLPYHYIFGLTIWYFRSPYARSRLFLFGPMEATNNSRTSCKKWGAMISIESVHLIYILIVRLIQNEKKTDANNVWLFASVISTVNYISLLASSVILGAGSRLFYGTCHVFQTAAAAARSTTVRHRIMLLIHNIIIVSWWLALEFRAWPVRLHLD